MSTNVSKAPRQLGSRAETFAALCRDFEIDKKVEVLLNESGMNNLEDFRYFFDDMENVRTFVAADKTLKENVLRIQVARLRNAWDSYCVLAKKRDQGQATHQTHDLDDPLEEETLRGVVENWWTRHKVKFPPNFTPGDQAIARCYRELMTRLLTVADVWKIKDRLHQVTSTSKKVRIANMDLWKGEAEKDPQHPRTASQYLRCLHTYFLALSIAGSSPLSGRPSTAENQAASSIEYVSVPWDVLLMYYYRAMQHSAHLPEGQRLRWLEESDVAERAVWAREYRETQLTLGKIVQNNFYLRAACWQPPVLNTAPANTFPPPSPWVDKQPRKRKGNPKGKGKGGGNQQVTKHPLPKGGKAGNRQKVGTWATHLINGEVLCQAFNKGDCPKGKEKSCASGAHKCSKVLKGGKPCGQSNHSAKDCRSA